MCVNDVSLGLSRLKRLLQIALGFIWRAVTALASDRWGARGPRQDSAARPGVQRPSGCVSAAAVREVGVALPLQVGLGDQEHASVRAAASPTRRPGAWGWVWLSRT